MNLQRIETLLRRSFHGPIVARESVSSTMDLAREFSEAEGPVAVIMTLEQTAGRGRQGRAWVSRRGDGFYCSVVYGFQKPIELVGLLPLAIGVALCRVLRSVSGVISVKWPNDIVIPGSERYKLAGILIESAQRNGIISANIGFGINLRGEPPLPGVSLEQIAPLPDLELLCSECVESVLEACRSLNPEVIQEFRAAHVLHGRRIAFEQRGETREGIVLDVSPMGALCVECDGEKLELYSGDVHLVRW